MISGIPRTGQRSSTCAPAPQVCAVRAKIEVMAQVTKVTQKDRERHHAGVFLQCIGEDPRQWDIVNDQGEKPDLVLKSPTGQVVGVEITELLTDDQGKLRKAEHLLCAVVKEVVEEFIASIGVPGAIVEGNNQSVAPPHELRLDELRVNLRAHLERHGHSLSASNGAMKIAFKHDWGVVSRIHRSDKPRVLLQQDRPDRIPSYKYGRSMTEIEVAVLAAVERKVNKSAAYSNQWPLWLAIRNPNHAQSVLSSACVEQARQLNGGRFARVVLFNDPEHVLDGSPPSPMCVEIV